MSEIYRLSNSNSTFQIKTPDTPTQKVVLFLPGISGDVFSDRFKPLVDACNAAGWAVALINAWENAATVEQKNLNQIYADIRGVITTLQQLGYTSVAGVGKSFGGGILLTCPSPYIQRKILWAPAIGVADSESTSNIEHYVNNPLNDLSSLLDLKVNPHSLKEMEVPILIIHGTADKNIPFSNSEKIVDSLPNAKMWTIEGADHSYKNKVHEEAVIKATVDFLTPELSELTKPWKPLR